MEKKSTIKRVRDLSDEDWMNFELRWVFVLTNLYDTCLDMEDFFDMYFSDIIIEEEEKRKQVEFLTLLKETLIMLTNTGLLKEKYIMKLIIMVETNASIDEIMEQCIDTSDFTSQYETVFRLVELLVNVIRLRKPKLAEVFHK